MGEIRVSHPGLAKDAETFWRASMVQRSSGEPDGIRASLDYAPFEAAEHAFVTAARRVLDE